MKIKRLRSSKPLIDAPIIAVDTESTGLSVWHGARPFAFSFYAGPDQTAYIEWPVDPMTREVSLEWRQYGDSVARMRTVLENPAIVKVFHNAKHDLRMFESIGIVVAGRIEDTLFMSHACNAAEDHGLKALAEKYLEMPADDESQLQKMVVKSRLIGKKLGWMLADSVKGDYWMPAAAWRWARSECDRLDLDPTVCKTYAMGDVIRTLGLYEMYKEIMPTLNVEKVYRRERKLFPIVYKMESRGVRINRKSLLQETEIVRKKAEKLRAAIDFNPDSPPQLSKYLFEELGLDPIKHTKTGRASTDAVVLDFYSEEPGVSRILEYRESKKLLSTYFSAYLRNVIKEPSGWTLHATFNQIGPITGRFSSRDPNLQNVPKRGDGMLTRARIPFVPRKGCVWGLADYSQIEARIFADEANEESMLESFEQGRDAYNDLALSMREFGAPLAADPKAARDQAKTIFLGRLYGLGEAKLARSLKTDDETASAILHAFGQKFPGIRRYMRLVQREASKEGEVRTRYGTLVPVPPGFEYKGVNYKIQGAAAILLKEAMIRCAPVVEKMGGHLLMQIHDELIFEMPAEKFKKIMRVVSEIMSDNRGVFRVKTPVEVSIVKTNWLEKKGVKL